MGSPRYGDPAITIRLPAWEITALKLIARKEGTTVSEIMRDMIGAVIHSNGITEKGLDIISNASDV